MSAVFQPGWYDNTFPGGNNYNWTAYLSTSWTIMDSGLTAGNLKAAIERYHKAQEQLRQTVDNVRLDVQSTYLSLKSSEQSIETSKSAVGLAEEDYKIKVIRYQAGVGTNLDVLDSQVALTTAKNNYLKAIYGNSTFRARLDQAMGIPVKVTTTKRTCLVCPVKAPVPSRKVAPRPTSSRMASAISALRSEIIMTVFLRFRPSITASVTRPPTKKEISVNIAGCTPNNMAATIIRKTLMEKPTSPTLRE